MATMKTDAQKVTELRKQAMDKSLPQEVRDMADKKANEIEGKSVEKATGMKLAKGGAVAKPMANKTKMAVGGIISVPNTPRNMQSEKRQLKAMTTAKPNMASPSATGVVAKKPTAKQMMAKGGAVKKAKK